MRRTPGPGYYLLLSPVFRVCLVPAPFLAVGRPALVTNTFASSIRLEIRCAGAVTAIGWVMWCMKAWFLWPFLSTKSQLGSAMRILAPCLQQAKLRAGAATSTCKPPSPLPRFRIKLRFVAAPRTHAQSQTMAISHVGVSRSGMHAPYPLLPPRHRLGSHAAVGTLARFLKRVQCRVGVIICTDNPVFPS